MRRGYFALVLMVASGPGCNKTVNDFVQKAAQPAPTNHELPPPTPYPEGPSRVQVGPGSVDATGGPIRLKAKVNANGRVVLMGSDRAARLTVGQAPVAF